MGWQRANSATVMPRKRVVSARRTSCCGLVIVEGAGGFMSPIGDHEYIADLAEHFGYPLVVVVPNRIGAINGTLLTLIAAAARPKHVPIAGIVLNNVLPADASDPAVRSNRV